MKSLKLIFKEGGAVFDFTETVDDFAAVAQAAIVTLATLEGSDQIYPDKGTILLQQASQGRLYTPNEMQHGINFAALDTFFFSRTYNGAAYPRIAEDGIRLELDSIVNSRMQLNMLVTSTDGETVGRSLTSNI